MTTVVNPTGPVNGGLVAYLSFYDALGDKCRPSYTLRGGDPGRRRTRSSPTPSGARDSASPPQGYAVTVPDFEGTDLHWVAGHESGWSTLDSIRATESYLGMSSDAEGRPVRLLRRLDRRRVGQRARAVVQPRSSTSSGPPIGGVPVHLAHNLGYVNGSRVLVRRHPGGPGQPGPCVRDRDAASTNRRTGGRSADEVARRVHRLVQRQLPRPAGPAPAQEEVPRVPEDPEDRQDGQQADHGQHPGPPADADVHGGGRTTTARATT